MDSTPFDAVVAGGRLVDMDGPAFLRRAKQSKPETVRISLTSAGDAGAAMRSLPVAHQCLSKPFDADVLIQVVERGTELQALLNSDATRRCSARSGTSRAYRPTSLPWMRHFATRMPRSGTSRNSDPRCRNVGEGAPAGQLVVRGFAQHSARPSPGGRLPGRGNLAEPHDYDRGVPCVQPERAPGGRLDGALQRAFARGRRNRGEACAHEHRPVRGKRRRAAP